ncbi:MAG TPA: hypothetical protein PL151_10835 [Phycisphaerae bacterium]|nr:hypothetical protein [Phycisphaerae bacterium]HOJ72738.1 hypothetical protein [Phycisphaerae bacterium]HOM51835.1 hypothetical protein [Phycisphaerae bacterium]HON67237.1 hypothetical protein [Phycisphaerae bacterium]HOQ84413.1 hypothetical protein [Phycisphaerae bacterium]
MEVLDQHQVTEDRMQSTDWTTIGTRILEAATIATAMHLEELELSSASRVDDRQTPECTRDIDNGNG